MPTYEYQCLKCGHKFDHFQSMNDLPLKKCPVCKGKVERLISGGVGLIFKGSGFYITDYTRSDDYKKKTKEDKSSPSTVTTIAKEKTSATSTPVTTETKSKKSETTASTKTPAPTTK